MKQKILFLLCLIPFSVFAQTDDAVQDSLAIDSLYETESPDHMSFYYSWDWETQPVFTGHGIYEGHQHNYESGITKSWTFGVSWTHQIAKHFYSIAGIEYSEKSVISDSIIPDPGPYYTSGVNCFNFPIGIRYDYGRKFRVGGFAGGAFKINFKDDNGFVKQCNADVRAGIFLEYRWKKCWLKIMPLYRQDLFQNFKQFESWNANSKGIQLEFTF